MDHEVTHDLPTEQAKVVAHRALESYTQRFAKYSPEVAWRSDTEADLKFTAKGVRLQGGLAVEPNRFRLRLDVPFLLRPFQRRAIEVIDAEVQAWIRKAKAGEV